MDKFEQKMQRASEELRQTTKGATPPMTGAAPAAGRPRWLAFAAGFAVVALAIGFLPTLLGGQNPPVGGPSPTDPPVISPPETPTTTRHIPDCSSDGVAAPRTPDGLPREVASRFNAIVMAAVDCDFDALEALAGPDFSIFFGAYGVEKFREWEIEGRGELGTLLKVLAMSFSRYEYTEPDLGVYYTWPAAFGYDHWDQIPQEYVDELLTLYTQEELDYMAQFGGYAGWRTGFTEDGTWRFFTSGD